jgi:hypothetical protein
MDTRARPLSPRRIRAAAAAIVLSFALSPATALAQSDQDKANARALATQGIEALNAGKFADALDLVTRAEQILHAPTHVLFIARAHAGLGHLVSAREAYLKLTREDLAANAPPAFKKAQQDGKDELAAIEPRIAQLRIVVDAPEQKKFTVNMDGQPVSPALLGVYRPVDPGPHEIALVPVGQPATKSSVELKDGEKKDLKLSLPDAAGPIADAGKGALGPGDKDKADAGGQGFFTPMRGAGIGAAALGVGGVVLGAVFMSKAGSTQGDADKRYDACTKLPRCPKAEQDAIGSLDTSAAGQKTIGAVGIIAGGVLVAGGVTLIILGKPKAKPVAEVTPWFSGNAAGLRGTF